MQKLKFILVFSLLCINLKATSNTRKPAVEPIMGSSIEEYQEVDPKDAKGYNFSRFPENNNFDKNAQEIYPPLEIAEQSTSEQSAPAQLLVLLFILLPIFASGFLFFRSFRKVESNVVRLADVKKKKNEVSNDDNIPKAS